MPEVHVYIEIDDLERGIEFYVSGLGLTVKRRLTERWVELAGAALERRVDHPGLWQLAALADPFGNGFDLITDPEAAYERLNARA
jgi:hypothetical protein